MNRYEDPGGSEEHSETQDQQSEQSHNDDFDNYPFLPPPEPSAIPQEQEESDPHPSSRLPRILQQTTLILAIAIVAFLGGWFCNQYFGNDLAFRQSGQSSAYEQLFDQAWETVDQHYVDRSDINYQKMSYAAINAMLDSLGDTGHTRFEDPQAAQQDNQQLSGTFTGIGIDLQQNTTTKQFVVASTISGSPAEKAGLQQGDIITNVNGHSLTGKTVDDVTTLIHGNAGTMVTLTVQRPGTSHPLTFNLIRAELNVPNVVMYYIPQDHTAHIQVIQFASGVSDQLRTDVVNAKKIGATRIVLDLRDNPGGYLDEAINTASLFIKSGNVFLQEDSTGKITPEPVNGNPVDTTTPVIVLVNENTASAAEIVAGALQDNHRATIVGERTFGTGTVLDQFPLPDGSVLLIGTKEWLTPNGQFLRKDSKHPEGGITPDITVADKTNDLELFPADESQEHITEQQILQGKDPQLIKALQLLDARK